MKFIVYKDAADEWRWRLQEANGRVTAASGAGYRDKKDCLYGIELVKLSFGTPVEDLSQEGFRSAGRSALRRGVMR
ncbi:MAG: DUF1508 domain-containing protein [Burkholderiales bacterium]|nr:DUF1508 domain-containing protein [Burkholderiales bacterium]